MSPLGEPDRALCATTAAWLDATRVLGWLGLFAGGVAGVHLLLDGTQPWIAAALMFLLLGERYLALRLAFDGAVFRALAEGPIEDPARFDHSLQQLGLRPGTRVERSVESRTRGAMRMSRAYLSVVAVQVVLCAVLLARSGH